MKKRHLAILGFNLNQELKLTGEPTVKLYSLVGMVDKCDGESDCGSDWGSDCGSDWGSDCGSDCKKEYEGERVAVLELSFKEFLSENSDDVAIIVSIICENKEVERNMYCGLPWWKVFGNEVQEKDLEEDDDLDPEPAAKRPRRVSKPKKILAVHTDLSAVKPNQMIPSQSFKPFHARKRSIKKNVPRRKYGKFIAGKENKVPYVVSVRDAEDKDKDKDKDKEEPMLDKLRVIELMAFLVTIQKEKYTNCSNMYKEKAKIVLQRIINNQLTGRQIQVLLEMLIVEITWFYQCGKEGDFNIKQLLERSIVDDVEDGCVSENLRIITSHLLDTLGQTAFFDALHMSGVIVNMLIKESHRREMLIEALTHLIGFEEDEFFYEEYILFSSYKMFVLYLLSHSELCGGSLNSSNSDCIGCFFSERNNIKESEFEGLCRNILKDLLEGTFGVDLIFDLERIRGKQGANIKIHKHDKNDRTQLDDIATVHYDYRECLMKVKIPRRFKGDSFEDWNGHVCRKKHGTFNQPCQCNIFYAGDEKTYHSPKSLKGLATRSLIVKKNKSCEFCNSEVDDYESYGKHRAQHNIAKICFECGVERRACADPVHHEEEFHKDLKKAVIFCPICKKCYQPGDTRYPDEWLGNNEEEYRRIQEEWLSKHMRTHPVVGRNEHLKLPDKCLYLCGQLIKRMKPSSMEVEILPCMEILDRKNSAKHHHYVRSEQVR